MMQDKKVTYYFTNYFNIFFNISKILFGKNNVCCIIWLVISVLYNMLAYSTSKKAHTIVGAFW
jgi:hypothetical protein